MKKLTLILLMIFSLNSWSQVSLCDSLIISGSQYQIGIAAYNTNTIIDHWVTTCPGGNILAEDSLVWSHVVFSNIAQDTLITCITSFQSTCCVTWVWDGSSWARMGTATNIEEIKNNNIYNNKIYDLLGRKLITPPSSGIYIRNNRLYMCK